MSCRMSGLRVTMPVPRGRLPVAHQPTLPLPFLRIRSPSHLQVSPDYVLQHRALAARLGAHDGDLGQIDGVLHADGGEDILQLIDERDQARVVDVDPARGWSVSPRHLLLALLLDRRTYALGFVCAMAGKRGVAALCAHYLLLPAQPVFLSSTMCRSAVCRVVTWTFAKSRVGQEEDCGKKADEGGYGREGRGGNSVAFVVWPAATT